MIALIRQRFAEYRERQLLRHMFDELFYIAAYKDVARSGLNPFSHYVRHGRLEGRKPFSDETAQALYAEDGPRSEERRRLLRSLGCFSFAATGTLISSSDGVGDPKPDEARQADPIAPRPSAFEQTIIAETSTRVDEAAGIRPRVVSFYLPQYHRIPENDEWWGEGFTEWTNVRKAKPNFVGHEQPRVPADMDYYDLSDVTVQVRQARLAREYGVSAFCFYAYWFNGRRLLEKPLDAFKEEPSVDIEFCICWANENWTRTWDGLKDNILLAQTHSTDSDRQFIRDMMKYFRDPRYLRVDGRLVLLVYRVDLIPDCAATAALWREEVRQNGLGELHLCAVQFYGIDDPRHWGFDAAVEFPPHGWLVQENLVDEPLRMENSSFTGTIFEYSKAVDYGLRKPIPSYRWYRGAFPGWDNTARRQDKAHIFARSNAFEFERWMTELLRQVIIMAPPEHQIVFVNAWNEWGEGAYLEPDKAHGRLNLQAVHSALSRVRHETEPLSILGRLRRAGVYPGRNRDERLLLNLLRGHEQATRALLAALRAEGAKQPGVGR